MARSMSPAVSSRARLQSIIPAPVASRRALTCSAPILTSVACSPMSSLTALAGGLGAARLSHSGLRPPGCGGSRR